MSKFALDQLAVIVVSEWPRNVGRIVRLVQKYGYRVYDREDVPIGQNMHVGWIVEDEGTFQGWDHSQLPAKVVITHRHLGISEWKIRPFVEGEPFHESPEGIFYVETPTI